MTKKEVVTVKKSAKRIFKELVKRYGQNLTGAVDIRYDESWRKVPVLVVYNGDQMVWSNDVPIHRGAIRKEVNYARGHY